MTTCTSCGNDDATLCLDCVEYPEAAQAVPLATISAVVRDYLTHETDMSRPSFHATALTHALAQAHNAGKDEGS